MDQLSDLERAGAFTRRVFLQRGVALASAASTIPLLIERSAHALAPSPGLSSIPGAPEERVLVVVQLSGGNDGLNTVIPFGMDAYYKARPVIGVAQRDALAKQIPLGRLGMPQDIADAVCFLAGPGAAWITGETLNVNGGMHMA